MEKLKQKILIVEDEPALRESIGLYLKDKNMDVFDSNAVEEAYKIIEREAPHIVLLDIYLGKELGLDLANRVSETDLLFRKPKILVMSGTVGGELLKTQVFLEDNHVDGFIKKPFDLSDLLVEIEAILNSDS